MAISEKAAEIEARMKEEQVMIGEQALNYEECVADCLKKMLKDEKVNWLTQDNMDKEDSADSTIVDENEGVEPVDSNYTYLQEVEGDKFYGEVIIVDGKLYEVMYPTATDFDCANGEDFVLHNYTSNEVSKADIIQKEYAEVVLVDGKLHHVIYPLYGDNYKYSGEFGYSDKMKLVTFSIDDIHKYFCIFLDSIFMRFNQNFGDIKSLYDEEINYALNPCWDVGNDVVKKMNLRNINSYYINISLCNMHFENEVEFEDFLKREYSKYGKYRMAILSSPLYPFGGRICDAKSVEYFIDEFAKELRDECEDCEPEVSYNVRSIITDIVARKNLKKNEYVTLLRDYFYGEWVLQTIHWNEYEDVKCSVEDINNRLEDKINELERKVFKYSIDVTII